MKISMGSRATIAAFRRRRRHAAPHVVLVGGMMIVATVLIASAGAEQSSAEPAETQGAPGAQDPRDVQDTQDAQDIEDTRLASGSRRPVVIRPSDIPWETRSSEVRVAVLYGDPQREGLFVLRLVYPPGYEKGPHFHPNDAYVSVTDGAYSRGYGATWDRARAFALRPGTFSVNPAGVSHYEWTRDGAALQVVARGPWKTVYVDKNGDPTDEMEKRPDPTSLKAPRVRRADELEWTEREAGVDVAILDGDPSTDGPFTLRLRLAKGYAKEPHSHSNLVLVTVLSGALRIGFGVSPGSQTTLLESGSFMALPPYAVHFESAPQAAVVEVHSTGPWTSHVAPGYTTAVQRH